MDPDKDDTIFTPEAWNRAGVIVLIRIRMSERTAAFQDDTMAMSQSGRRRKSFHELSPITERNVN